MIPVGWVLQSIFMCTQQIGEGERGQHLTPDVSLRLNRPWVEGQIQWSKMWPCR